MDETTRDVLRAVMEEFKEISYISPEDIPDIPLYMDQITTFMDAKLAACKRYPDDKILTKTMINNYTKNKLLPPPEKKKYSREHLLLLIYIYYLKDFLSISDIQTLLGPLEDRHFHVSDGITMPEIYQEAFDLIKGQTGYMSKDLLRRWKMAESAFTEAPEDSEEYLHLFAFVCLLSFDVYVKKKLIETVVDKINLAQSGKGKKKKQSSRPDTPDDTDEPEFDPLKEAYDEDEELF